MTKARLLTAVLALPAAAAAVYAQAPTGLPATQSVPFNGSPLPPFAPVPGVGSPVGIAPTPPLPTSPTLWSFLGLSNAQREFRQRALADTPLGELRSKVREPLSKATGGLIPPIPPATPSLAELMDPGAVGAAAKVKLDRAAAKKRIKAVQYLGTVDCHYWPEAEEGLVNALRADRNEWVRLAAAQTLLKGCCCTKKTILALTMAATCSNADGNPAEKSPRVAAAAQAALTKCLDGLCAGPVFAEGVEAVPVDPKTDDKPKGEGEKAAMAKPGPAGAEKGAGGLTADQVAHPSAHEIYERAAARPMAEMIAFSRAHLAKAPAVPVEYLREALAELDVGGSDDDAPTPTSAQKRPTNLYDALFSDANVAKVPAPRPLPATMPPAAAMTAMRPAPAARPAPASSQVTSALSAAPAPVPPPIKAAPPAEPARMAISVPAAKSAPVAPPVVAPVVKPAEPARVAVHVPAAKPTPPPAPMPAPAPAVRQATLTAPAKPVPTTAAGRAMGAIEGKDGKAIVAAAELLGPADVSAGGPVPAALLATAEHHADPAARSACVRALARCQARTPAVLAGLERMVNDRNVDVRVDAAVALGELKAAK